MPGARRMLELEEWRFDQVLALSKETKPIDAAEAATSFAPPSTEATHTAIRDQVLRVWRHKCAFTGALETDTAHLSIVAIRPRDQGGPLHVGNYLPMIAGLERAWRSGHFSVGEDHRILGDLYRLAPEDQDSMVALFKMLLPDDPKDYPDPKLLAWHRLNVFGRS
jgi:predicted restriction endonuclease